MNMPFRCVKMSAQNSMAVITGQRKNLCLYDGTAPDAVDQLASSLLRIDAALGKMVWAQTGQRVETARTRADSPDIGKHLGDYAAKF